MLLEFLYMHLKEEDFIFSFYFMQKEKFIPFLSVRFLGLLTYNVIVTTFCNSLRLEM